MVRRIYVEKKPALRQETAGLLRELQTLLGVSSLTGLRLLNRYDAEGLDEATFQRAVRTVFSEPQVDDASAALPAGAPVLAGYLDGTPVGAVAFDDGREAERGRGWIPLLAVAEPWRRRGYGVQLIGQAVMHYRPMGRDRLRLPTPETEAAAGFYREFGFSPAADGPAWEKFIGYDPEFLGA